MANAQHSQLQLFPDQRGPARVRRLQAVRRCAIQPGRSRWSTHHHALSLPLQYSRRSTWQVVPISAVLCTMRLCPTRIVRHRHHHRHRWVQETSKHCRRVRRTTRWSRQRLPTSRTALRRSGRIGEAATAAWYIGAWHRHRRHPSIATHSTHRMPQMNCLACRQTIPSSTQRCRRARPPKAAQRRSRRRLRRTCRPSCWRNVWMPQDSLRHRHRRRRRSSPGADAGTPPQRSATVGMIEGAGAAAMARNHPCAGCLARLRCARRRHVCAMCVLHCG